MKAKTQVVTPIIPAHAELSDTPAFLTAISSDLGQFPKAIITWDIMAKGTGSNNLFGKTETEADYETRLAKMGQALGKFLTSTENVAVVNLQNVPVDQTKRDIFLNALRGALQPNNIWDIDRLFSKSSEEVGVLTIINRQLTHVNDCRAVTDPSTAKGLKLAQVSDLILKKQNANEEDIAFRSINGVFGSDQNAVEEALAKLDNGYRGQVITSAIYGLALGALDVTDGQNYLYQQDSSWSGFHFKHNPATYELAKLGKVTPQPAGTPQSPQAGRSPTSSPAPAGQSSPSPQGPAPATATSEGKINSRLDWSTFVTKFAQGDYKVEKTSTNSAKVINTKDPNEFVTVNKITQDRMSVTASNLEGKTLNKLIEVAKEVYEPGTVVSIDITQGNPPLTDPETQRIKNELWLKAVNSGLKVKNHIPDDAFLTANDKDIPEQYKKKPEPPPSSPSPGRS